MTERQTETVTERQRQRDRHRQTDRHRERERASRALTRPELLHSAGGLFVSDRRGRKSGQAVLKARLRQKKSSYCR